MTERKGDGKRFKLRASMSGERISPRSIAMRWRARRGDSGTNLKTAGTNVVVTVDLKFVESRRKYGPVSASAASSGTQRFAISSKEPAGNQRITKSLFWSARREPIS